MNSLLLKDKKLNTLKIKKTNEEDDRIIQRLKSKNEIHVIFLCDWKDSEVNLEELKMYTPNNLGIYGKLVGTSNLKLADIVIFLENIPKNFKKLLVDKLVICYPREPHTINKSKPWEKLKYKYGFTYDNIYHVFADPKFLNRSYNYLSNLNYDNTSKIKKLSAIVSGKSRTEGHFIRKKFMINLSNKFGDNIDIFGGKWNDELNEKSYKGELGFYHDEKNTKNSKFEGLANYEYSLCIENVQTKNYFTEKFTDCILCNTIPIYYGCNNISEYFPKDSFYTFDINDSKACDVIEEIIKKPITEENILALKKAKDLILNKYNIWSTTEDILNNYLK